MLAIDHGRPRVMNLKELMTCFIEHRFEVLTRRTKFELREAEARAHILEGLLDRAGQPRRGRPDHPRVEQPRRRPGRS